jgi:4-hydroxybenzoate polyprenyltransferase
MPEAERPGFAGRGGDAMSNGVELSTPSISNGVAFVLSLVIAIALAYPLNWLIDRFTDDHHRRKGRRSR